MEVTDRALVDMNMNLEKQILKYITIELCWGIETVTRSDTDGTLIIN